MVGLRWLQEHNEFILSTLS
uniref:Uncharacterized protein n=1 Tax=Arundo donax TaxID=35708 RepID=A0A0A9BKX6_ARUDO